MSDAPPQRALINSCPSSLYVRQLVNDSASTIFLQTNMRLSQLKNEIRRRPPLKYKKVGLGAYVGN